LEVAVQQLPELLRLRRAHLRPRRRLLRTLALAFLRAGGLQLTTAAGGLVLAIGLGRLLGLGVDLLLHLLLALLLAALGLAVARAAALRALDARARVVALVARTAALVLLGGGRSHTQPQPQSQ